MTTKARMQTDAEMEAAGWAAWSRDNDGFLCTSHAPFESRGEWEQYVIEETMRGNRVAYPFGPMKMEASNE
ncbi:MAG: hypothetical protein U5N55_04795 [Cypionkella sp.]|nr:hypothetical protein [Cypionkella sp.]